MWADLGQFGGRRAYSAPPPGLTITLGRPCNTLPARTKHPPGHAYQNRLGPSTPLPHIPKLHPTPPTGPLRPPRSSFHFYVSHPKCLGTPQACMQAVKYSCTLGNLSCGGHTCTGPPTWVHASPTGREMHVQGSFVQGCSRQLFWGCRVPPMHACMHKPTLLGSGLPPPLPP
jgi:hypothetical protein